MTDFRALEYDSLRTAIRMRMTLAPVLLVVVMVGWAALTLWVFTTDVVSVATLVPLMVLAAGYEALYALHVSAERLARYLQVAYEEPIVSGSATPLTPTPQWETTSLYYRQRLSPVGSNALFCALFILATLVNYVPAAVSGTVEELVGIGVAHVLFAVRIIMAGRLAARVRSEDLERLRTLLNTTKSAPPH
jgi:small neutral amino acid transporter SnatA (MarC family)